ncbi:flagellar attachment zone protein 1-like [Haliotis cracherodii]|uniref:flagellar attachment zone protein 1-like n=1 Tax=Haliotis cracherodii TaxID=6455 RepID=UPI0039E94A67
MAEPVRLSKSLENLAADDITPSLADKKSFSKSVDNLEEEFSLQSADKTSVDLNNYFDDNEEGTDEDSKSETFDNNDLGYDENEGSNGLKNIEASLSRMTRVVDSADQSDCVSSELEPRKDLETSFYESNSKSSSSKHSNVMKNMLVIHGKEKSVLDKNWEEVKIDKDLQVSVNELLKGFFESYLNGAHNDERILLIKALHERALKAEISKWLCAKLQIERDGWSLKLRMALKEVEENRKTALKAAAILQDCSSQLRLLLECFSISDSLLDSIPHSSSREEIQRSLELLVEICNALMEDRFQCMQLLDMEEEEQEGGEMLAVRLQQQLLVQQHSCKHQVQEATEKTKQAESENLKLLKEVVKMKKVLGQKQQDVEWLRQQMTDFNEVVAAKQVKVVDKSTSTESTADQSRPNKSQRPLTESVISTQKTSSTKMSQRPATETQTSTKGKEASVIHISQEKLHALKLRAKKLEDSLHDAIASMDRLRKSTGPVTNSHNLSLANDIDLSPLILNGDGQASLSRHTGSKKNWQRASFEVKGAPNTMTTKTLNPIPKLNLKHSSKHNDKRSISERGPPKETYRQLEVKKTAELSATLAHLKAFKPQVGKVSKCLRCQKLFRSIDNHKLACLYHAKSKERVEKYTEGGQLVRVLYMWTCCKQEVDSEGCCYGQHV